MPATAVPRILRLTSAATMASEYRLPWWSRSASSSAVQARGAGREDAGRPLADRGVVRVGGGEVVGERLVQRPGLAERAARLDAEAVDHGVRELVVDDVVRQRRVPGERCDPQAQID